MRTEHFSQQLVQCFSELPERERLIVALYYYENLALAEIAGIMNLTEKRVSIIINKALTEMREHIKTGG